jgi:hypothetical protein
MGAVLFKELFVRYSTGVVLGVHARHARGVPAAEEAGLVAGGLKCGGVSSQRGGALAGALRTS